jgi:hypothetical protein
MQYNPYHLDHRWELTEGRERDAAQGFPLQGVIRSLVWLLVIAAIVVALAAGTQPQLLVNVLDLVLLLAAGSMTVCVTGLVLLNLSDRLSGRTRSAAR